MVLNAFMDMVGFARRRREIGAFEQAQEAFDTMVFQGLKHTARAGHMVQSVGEKKIADRLWDMGEPYIYDTPIEINGLWVRPDFILPERNNLIVEFKGMNTLEYNEKFARKIEILKATDMPFLVVEPGDLGRLDKFFA